MSVQIHHAGGGSAGASAAESSTTDTQYFVISLSSSYDNHEVEAFIRPANDGVGYNIEFSTDSGTSWLSSGYKFAIRTIYSSGFVTDETNNGAAIITFGEPGNGASEGVAVRIKSSPIPSGAEQVFAYDAQEVTHHPYFTSRIGAISNTTTTKIDAIRFSFATGNIASGIAKVYGK